jgi:hypothetical protein
MTIWSISIARVMTYLSNHQTVAPSRGRRVCPIRRRILCRPPNLSHVIPNASPPPPFFPLPFSFDPRLSHLQVRLCPHHGPPATGRIDPYTDCRRSLLVIRGEIQGSANETRMRHGPHGTHRNREEASVTHQRPEAEDLAPHRPIPAPPGTPRNAPDQIRTGDLRLERPTLFGPPEGPVDH